MQLIIAEKPISSFQKQKEFCPELKKMLAEYGIALVFLSQETLVIPLWGRKLAGEKYPFIYHDERADTGFPSR